MVEESVFSNLYTLLDNYETKLVTGMTTGDSQTQLLQTLTSLYQQVELLD